MAQVTVIIDDNLIIVDEVVKQFAFDPLFNNLNAIHWNGTSGVFEFKAGSDVPFDNVQMITPYIEQFNNA